MAWRRSENTRADLLKRVAGFAFFAVLATVGYLLDAPSGFVAANLGLTTGWGLAALYRWGQLHGSDPGLDDASQ